MTVSHGPPQRGGSPKCTVIDTDNFSGCKRQPAPTHECPRWIYAAASMVCRRSADDREQLRTLMWLGREDSNLRMAESKSAALPLGYAPAGRLACAAAARGTIAAANWPSNGSKGGAGVSR